jgi:phosphoribosyl 1,2-cyclic phosphodiesterase
MKIHFWGTRGSLPRSYTAKMNWNKIVEAFTLAQGVSLDSTKAIESFVNKQLPFAIARTYGTNTPCIEISNTSREYILCDAGSGLKDFSNYFSSLPQSSLPCVFHIFLSHLHWDHIMGFPFFVPIFKEGHTIILHGHHEEMEAGIHTLLSAPFFPVDFSELKARIQFDVKPKGALFEVGGYRISSFLQKHSGLSYAYRFEKEGKSFIYSTDSEHDEAAYSEDYPFLKFIQDTDLLIFDAMYSLAKEEKKDWGHSNYLFGVELATRARVKKLALFHLDPDYNDYDLDNVYTLSKAYVEEFSRKKENNLPLLDVVVAYDGLEVVV